MSLMNRGAGMRASVTMDPLNDFWYSPVGGSSTYAGVSVSPDMAMRVSAVFACVDVLSVTMASLPLDLFRRLSNGGKEKALDHPLYPVLSRRPNGWQTRFEFIEYMVRQFFLRGNGFAEKNPSAMELYPIHPDTVTTEMLPTRRLRYRIKPVRGGEYTRSQDDILHIRDASDDTIVGIARAVLAREAIAVAAEAERFAGRFLKNDGSGRVMLEHPAKLDDKTRAEIRRVNAEMSGANNKGKLLIAEGGAKYNVLPSLDDSAFLVDPRKFQLADICRFFGRVPPFMIGHEDRATWGTNIESTKDAFVTYCARPLGTRIVQALERDLLLKEERKDYFIAFNYADLLTGNLLEVVQAIGTQREHGILNANEGRALLNMNPRTDPGGEVYQDTPTGASPNAATTGAKKPAQPQQDDPSPDQASAGAVPPPLLADAALRIAQAELNAVKRRASRAGGADTSKWKSWLEKDYQGQREYVRKVLTPLALSYRIADGTVEKAAWDITAGGFNALETGIPENWEAARPVEVAGILELTFAKAA